MSVHVKKRIPPHKHFRDEIEEARQVRPGRPGYKGVHWSDVVVDSTLLLNETLVAWTRQYEEDDDKSSINRGSFVSDATASKGQCLKVLSTEASGWAWACPYPDKPTGAVFGAGNFHVLFRLKVASKASGSNIAAIHVATNRGTQEFLIKPNMFPNANVWHTFALSAEVRGDDTYAYLALHFYTGVTDLYFDWAGYLPKHIPIGYADVTVLTEDPGSTGDYVDPGSAGDNVDPGSTGDNVDPGTAAANGYMPDAALLSLGDGSQVSVGSTFVTLRSGTCGSTSNPINLAKVLTKITRGASGGSGHVQIRFDTAGYQADFHIHVTQYLNEYYLSFIVPRDLCGDAVYVYARSDGAVYLKANLYVYQFKKHTHNITGDAHTTPISGDAHTTPISGDGHTTPISGDSHAHSDQVGGHEH